MLVFVSMATPPNTYLLRRKEDLPNMSATVNNRYSDPSAPCILGLFCNNMAIYFSDNNITDSDNCVAVRIYNLQKSAYIL